MIPKHEGIRQILVSTVRGLPLEGHVARSKYTLTGIAVEQSETCAGPREHTVRLVMRTWLISGLVTVFEDARLKSKAGTKESSKVVTIHTFNAHAYHKKHPIVPCRPESKRRRDSNVLSKRSDHASSHRSD